MRLKEISSTATFDSFRSEDLSGLVIPGGWAPDKVRRFGKALTYSLENARVREDGYAVWEEEDYCSPPLKEEREAVLDEYFKEIQVESVKSGTG